MTTLILFAIAGLITFALRTGLVFAGIARPLPDQFNAAIGILPPAILTAIVTAALFVSDQRVRLANVAELVAVGAAVIAVRKFGNPGFALLVGLPVYWLISALGF